MTLTGWIPKLIGLGIGILFLGLAAAAIYYIGLTKGENKADVEIEKYRGALAELNIRQVEREKEVGEKVIERYNTVRIERQPIIIRNQEVIRSVVPTGNNISKGAVHAHDQSARGEAIDPAKAADASASATNERDLIGVVNSNYDLARANADRQNALIDWHEQIKKAQKPDEATK